MTHNVHESLTSLLTPISQLVTLPGNPRKGAVDAIMASYEQFGQLKPIVGMKGEDGKITVIAGNHQFQAAQELGWTHMAVLVGEWESVDDALAFAIADNRTAELGSNDEDLLYDMLTSIVESNEDLLNALEYDAFELALMESMVAPPSIDREDFSQGFTPPVIVDPTDQPKPGAEKEEDEVLEVDEQTMLNVVTQGADAVGRGGSERTSYNYSLVFSSLEEQAEWYRFLRFLKDIPELRDYPTATQLIQFLKNHHEF